MRQDETKGTERIRNEKVNDRLQGRKTEDKEPEVEHYQLDRVVQRYPIGSMGEKKEANITRRPR